MTAAADDAASFASCAAPGHGPVVGAEERANDSAAAAASEEREDARDPAVHKQQQDDGDLHKHTATDQLPQPPPASSSSSSEPYAFPSTYKPGKTARKTARRRAREAAERAAGAVEGDVGAASKQTSSVGAAGAPAVVLSGPPDEDTLEVLEEGEKDDAFNSAIPLPVRVGAAAQAFVRKGKKRRINSRQENLLKAYLNHGGIKLQKTAAPKKEDNDNDMLELDDVPSMEPINDSDDEGEEFDKNEMSEQKVVDDSDSDDSDDDSDEEDGGVRQVDFFGVTSSFLSSYILGPDSRFVEMEDIREAPRVCETFLNYLCIRNAAPEYESEIRRSIELCKQAAEELPRCKALSCLFPGKFNMACSVRFGGEYYQWLDLCPEDAIADEKVTTVEGVKIFQAPDISKSQEIEGWGPPPKIDPAETRKRNKGRTAEDWDQGGETESILGVTKHEIVKFTSRFHSLTEDVPKPERHYTLARVVAVPDPASVLPPSSETPIPGANLLGLCEAFFPTKLKFMESAEDELESSEGPVVQIYFDENTTRKLRTGMLLEAAFYKLRSGHWYIGQVAYVLPSYTKEDFE